METLIIEHVDNSTATLIKELIKKLGFSIKTKIEDESVITNPEVLNRIEKYENKKSKTKSYSTVELKKNMQIIIKNA